MQPRLGLTAASSPVDGPRRSTRSSRAVTLLALSIAACSSKIEPRPVTADSDGDSDCAADACGDSDVTSPLPAPYTSLTFDVDDVEVAGPTTAAGYQGKLLRGDDGTLYYAYLRYVGSQGTCDIAVFGGPTTAPDPRYDLHLATLAPGATSFDVETVPLAGVPAAENLPYVGTMYGLSGVIDPANGDVVLAFAAGGPGLATCSSSDLVIARRAASGAWSFTVPLPQDSGACCSVEECVDPACLQGTDIGAWATVAALQGGGLAVAYADYHNYWDQDGQNYQGYELWQSSSGAATAIRPWSGMGNFGSMVTAADGTLVVAYTGFKAAGAFVSHRTGNAGGKADWQTRDLRPGATIGERMSLAVAPDGTLGLAMHVRQNASAQVVEDLLYCHSTEDGVTWQIPCETVDSLNSVGQTPSLAFDSQSRPAISYYYCGTSGNCQAGADGLRYAWRDAARQTWARVDVLFDASTASGLYTSLVIDPDTDEPTIAFHDKTRGAAVVARGRLTSGTTP